MENTTQEKPQIKVSDVLAMLNDGKTRDDIANHYGITKPDCKRLFEHPSLKGKKTKKKPGFILVDDTEIEQAHNDSVVEEVQHDVAAEVASIQEEEGQNWEN